MSFVPYGRIGSFYVPQPSELWKEQVRIAKANKEWLHEVTPVLFGCYAWLEGEVQEDERQDGGHVRLRRGQEIGTS